MCGGTAKVDTSIRDQMQTDAAAARAQEEARQGRIRSGNDEISQVFGGFDDGFFNTFRDNILNLQRPALDRQFGDARDKLTYSLARAGTLRSSMAGEKSADLNRTYTDTLTGLTADASGSADELRNRVAGEKSSLVSLLNATGDSERASNEALARSQILFQKQPSYNPIGDVFGGLTSGIGNYYAGKQNQDAYSTYFGSANARDRSTNVR